MKDDDLLLGANKKLEIYLDEIWIQHQTATDIGVRRNDNPGRRWITVHAGSETIFRDQMNAENFT